jgi:hypothetical protein
VSVRIYVEGGGPSKGKNAAIKCRQAFSLFFDKLLASRKYRPHLVASGARTEAYNDFTNAVASKQYANDKLFLLVDSETAVPSQTTAKDHLRLRDGWTFTNNVSNDQIHMMVQCMEAWFMAHRDVVAEYYDGGFSPNSLPNNPNIEAINKKDILEGLKNATRQTKKKGYDKGTDAFAILGSLDPNLVCEASPRAAQLRASLLSSLT